MNLLILFILGQVHLPSLVQAGMIVLPFIELSGGAYMMTEEHNMSLTLGNFLNHINGDSSTKAVKKRKHNE